MNLKNYTEVRRDKDGRITHLIAPDKVIVPIFSHSEIKAKCPIDNAPLFRVTGYDFSHNECEICGATYGSIESESLRNEAISYLKDTRRQLQDVNGQKARLERILGFAEQSDLKLE